MNNLLRDKNRKISTILALVTIPISGLAVDVYLPSFPNMVVSLGTSQTLIQSSITVFLMSYGGGQLLLGSFVDSFGRYRINLVALSVFVFCSIGIALSASIDILLSFRFIQGLAVALIMVSRRAFILDVYTGSERKHYTSLLNVFWSTAPIVAPFVGGYLQKGFGWTANFYFLALYGLLILVFEAIYGGETIVEKHVFHFKTIIRAYGQFFRTHDFVIGILVLGLSYSSVIVFGISIPFIVEHNFGLSAVTTGYASLISGIAIFSGGFLAKKMLDRKFQKKLIIANAAQMAIAVIMFIVGIFFYNLFSILAFVIAIHFLQGFTYNTYFTYALNRFPKYAATASGVLSGGSYIVFSASSYAVVNILSIVDQKTLALSYIIPLIPIIVLLCLVGKYVVHENHGEK